MYHNKGKKRRGVASTTTPEHNQQKQFYLNSYSLSSLIQIGEFLLLLLAGNEQQKSWQQFEQMIAAVQCPVYALGGMLVSDLADAKQAGAQGIAVSSFWNSQKN